MFTVDVKQQIKSTLLLVSGLSSSDISRIRLYLDRIVEIGGFSGLLVIICFFVLVKSWDINKSSRFIVLAFVTALLMSLIGYPLRVKFLIRICDALSNKLSVLHIRLNRRTCLYLVSDVWDERSYNVDRGRSLWVSCISLC